VRRRCCRGRRALARRARLRRLGGVSRRRRFTRRSRRRQRLLELKADAARVAGEVLDARALLRLHEHQELAAAAHRLALVAPGVGQVDRREDVAIRHVVVAVEHDVAGGRAGVGALRQRSGEERQGKREFGGHRRPP
jgi:hypothetical protein